MSADRLYSVRWYARSSAVVRSGMPVASTCGAARQSSPVCTMRRRPSIGPVKYGAEWMDSMRFGLLDVLRYRRPLNA